MVQYNRIELLNHPVCKKYLAMKWCEFSYLILTFCDFWLDFKRSDFLYFSVDTDALFITNVSIVMLYLF